MKHEVLIEGICYVFSFENNNFAFYIDVEKSKKSVLVAFEEFEDFAFGEEAPEKLFAGSETKSIFRIKKELVSFIESILEFVKPHFFRYSANEARKFTVYQKVAEKLSMKYGYYLLQEGALFSFYKIN